LGAGRAEVPRGGVVRDPEVHRRGLHDVARAALSWQAETRAVVDSGLPGPKGNREFFLYLVQREPPRFAPDLDRWIAEAVDA